MNAPGFDAAIERDWDLSTRAGWFDMAAAEDRARPEPLTSEQIKALPQAARRSYDLARADWHANLGPIRTPGLEQVFDALGEICGSNLHEGGRAKPAAVLDAMPGLGKTTCALAFGKAFHRGQIDRFGPEIPAPDGVWQRVPVAYLPLTSNTTMRSLNAMLCRFYGMPGRLSGNAMQLAHRAAQAVAECKTRLVIVDDVHFVDFTRRDGQEVANHFKWLANTFPVTFLFVGVGLRSRGLLDESLGAGQAALSQTARRWTVLGLEPFARSDTAARSVWRQLLLGIEREVVLANGRRGMIADELGEYLFTRSTGHFASLMSLINRGCFRAVTTGAEALSAGLLDAVRIDEAAETARTALRRNRPTGGMP